MSWIGRKIYEYLKECEEFKKDMCAGYQPNDRLDTSNPTTNELPNFKFTPPPPEPIFPSDEYIDERKTAPEPPCIDEEMSKAKGRVPKTDNIPPAPKKKLKPFGICTETGMLVFCNDAKDYLTYKEKQPERVPFENFKNNRKKMKKEVRHCERFILTSVTEDGKVSITIEPKKGYDVCNVSLNVVTAELPKEPVLPKELLNPKPELQDQYDTLAKLIATRDYYNAGSVFFNSDIVAVIIVDCVSQDIVGHGVDVRFGKTKSKLYFKNALTADIFLNNFRSEIESVKHLI